MFHFQRTPVGRRWLAGLLAFLLMSLLAGCTNTAPKVMRSQATPTDQVPPPVTSVFAAVDPNYLYTQLDYMTSHFWRRESGFDTSLPSGTNGHDEFANYWAQEMLKNMQGFGAQAAKLSFTGNGWQTRPAQLPGNNVEVTIAGALHPEQVIVIGSHYDGMASSSQSAYDDAAGCAAELAAARALAQYWRVNHLYPALTLRFIIFDAEEQGLIGSYQYVNTQANGDLSHIVAMINEEQMGINYPLRFLGKDSNGPLALDIVPTDATNAAATHLRNLVQGMVAPVMQEMRTLGYTTLTYHGAQNQEVREPIFTPDQARYLPVIPSPFFGSDDYPFDAANIPTVTFGDFNNVPTAQDPNAPDPNLPQKYVYPNDTPWDTLQLMNGYASGSTSSAPALKLAFALPAMLTDWLLTRPDFAGLVHTDALAAGPIATMGDIGTAQPGQPLHLNGQAVFNPTAAHSQFSYHWDFGDGQQADGLTVEHTYASAGTYTLALTVSDQAGTRKISTQLQVASSPPNYSNPGPQFVARATKDGNYNNPNYQPPPITGDLNPPASTAPPPGD